MLQGEHSAILLTLIKPPFFFKIFVLSIFEWLFTKGFTVKVYLTHSLHRYLVGINVGWRFAYLHTLFMYAGRMSEYARLPYFKYRNLTLVSELFPKLHAKWASMLEKLSLGLKLCKIQASLLGYRD